MNLQNLSFDLLELIFELLPFSDKVALTTIEAFKFLRSTCPQSLLTEIPSLILVSFYKIQNYEDYYLDRYSYFINIISDKGYQIIMINNDFQIYDDEKKLILSIHKEKDEMKKCCLISQNYYTWIITIITSKGQKFEYFYDYNLCMKEIIYYKNNIAYVISEPLYEYGYNNLNLLDTFSLDKLKHLYILSPLISNELKEKSYGAKTIDLCDHWMYDENDDYWIEHKIVSLEKNDKFNYDIGYRIKIPIIYIKTEPFDILPMY